MREYLTSDDICNQISMSRSVFGGAVLIVEGVTDSRLFRKFIDCEEVEVFVAHSKDNVRDVISKMHGERKDGRILGIVDPDLDRIRGRKARSPLFFTDCRDMEMMIIRSNALNDVIDEYGDPEEVRRFQENVGPIRDALVSASYPIGLLMYVSQKEGLSLSFKDLDFERFVNPRTLSLDVYAMVEAVLNNSGNCRIGRKALIRMLDDESGKLEDIWHAARGHDTVDILLIGLKKNFGSFNSKYLSEGELGGALRLAFSDQCFVKTKMYADTSSWAEDAGLRLWDIVSRSRSPLPLSHRRTP